MSVSNVKQAIATALKNAETVEVGGKKKASLTLADALAINQAVGDYLDSAEKAEVQKVVKKMHVGVICAVPLAAALSKPALSKEKQAELVRAKQREHRETAVEVCNSAFFTLFLPGTCMITAASAVTLSEKRAKELID